MLLAKLFSSTNTFLGFLITLIERVFVVIILLFGGMIYSFILTIFSSLVINKDKRNKVYQEKVLILDNIRKTISRHRGSVLIIPL